MKFIREENFLRILTKTIFIPLCIMTFSSCITPNQYEQRSVFSNSLNTRELLIRDFLSNVKSTHNFIESQYDTAQFLQRRGKHLAAIEVLREILSIDPLNVKAFNLIGVSYDFLGEFDLAEAAYKDALKIQPDSAYTHNNLGFSYLIQGKYDLSIEAFKKAVAIDDQKIKFRHNLGLAYARKGDVKAALAQFQITGNGAADQGKPQKSIVMETSHKKMRLRKGQTYHSAVTSQTGATQQEKIAIQHSKRLSEKKMKSTNIRDPVSQFELMQVSTASNLKDDKDRHAWKNVSDLTKCRNQTYESEKSKSALIITDPNKPHFSVQIGVFRNEFYAVRLKEKIANEGLTAYISKIKNASLENLYRVRVCCFEDRKEADTIQRDLFENNRIEGFVVREVSSSSPLCEQSHPHSPGSAERQAIKNAFKVEVSNGNGINKMAQRVASYLSERGHMICRFSNADNFSYQDTIIYYQKDYLHDAYEVAKLIPGYQKMKKAELFGHKDIAVRVVIGKDLVPQHDFF